MNIILKVLPRILRAITIWPFTPHCVEKPRLIMTLLVKNEADKLEQNLLFHHEMGVDGFIVTNNNSSDTTPDILRRYKEKGWILEIIDEPSTGYEQKLWVDRMVVMAIKKYHADWIINADADELWYAPSGCLKTELAECRSRIMKCEAHCMMPEEDKPFTEWTQRVEPVNNPEQYDLSPYSIFQPQRGKVAHRAAGYLHIAMGNHKVAMLPRTKTIGPIRIYHYSVGTRQVFIDKMVQGGRELEKHSSKHGGRHWRYFYQLWKEGRLSEEYDRVIGLPQREHLIADGRMVEDTTIRDYFRKHHLEP